MRDPTDSFAPAQGKISRNISENTLVSRTLDFVAKQLSKWRDDPTRPAELAEEALNSQLCKYLNIVAGEQMPMVRFHHEERQGGRRQVDISALPSSRQLIGARTFSIYDPFTVIEGKRLPTPRNSPSREREYVSGGEDRSGGIQRFKLGLHGATVQIAGLVAYIQDAGAAEWLDRVNGWIRDLARNGDAPEKWNESEQLDGFDPNSASRVARSASSHPRVEAVSKNIIIRHLWVEM